MLQRVWEREGVGLTYRSSTTRVKRHGLGKDILNTSIMTASAMIRGILNFQVQLWAECGHSLAFAIRQIQTIVFSHR